MDRVPEEGNLIYSIADLPKKQRDKNSQDEKYVHMWPKKPATDVRLKKHMPLHKERKYDFSRSQPTKGDKLICSDKNCQEIKWPKKPKSVMRSVTIRRIGGQPNLKLEDYVETGTVNLQDVIRI